MKLDVQARHLGALGKLDRVLGRLLAVDVRLVRVRVRGRVRVRARVWVRARARVRARVRVRVPSTSACLSNTQKVPSDSTHHFDFLPSSSCPDRCT